MSRVRRTAKKAKAPNVVQLPKLREVPPMTSTDQVHAEAFSDNDREKAMARGYASACLEKYLVNPGVADAAAVLLLRELLQLASSRRGSYDLLKVDRGQSSLPVIVARLRAMPSWRPSLELVVDNS